ncbi:MAG: zinc ABC transporter substrate-binding protein [Anaerolineales bacterium]|nr:zinc ABC transporter substrate-binding protein [Anaerolineales bacterium]
MKRVWLLLLVALFISLLSPVQAQDERLTVIGSTTIVADVLQHVAGDAADVVSLMQYGQNPHTFEPTGQDIALLDEADVVFVNGAGFEEGLLPVFEEGTNSTLVEISACVNILSFGADMHEHEGEDADHDHEGEDADHDHEGEAGEHDHELDAACMGYYETLGLELHEDEAHLGMLHEITCGAHEHEDEGAEEEDEHEPGSCDPHIWTDVQNVMLWTLYARDVLSELDPMHADVYAANAAAYVGELQALDAEVEAILAPIPEERRVLVTNHQALGYMAYRYDLQMVGTVIPGGSTTAEPSAEDVAALIEVIEDYGVPAIFTENIVSNTLATQIAEATGAQIAQLYTGSLNSDAPTYVDYMRYNATTIAAALGE